MLPNGIPWVLKSDLDIIGYDKEAIPLCKFMRRLAVEGGLADLDVEYHVLVPKTNPAEDHFIGRVA